MSGLVGGIAAFGSQQSGKFTLVNLCGGPTLQFRFFPAPPISTGGHVNFEEQDTTIGTKPLFYFNRNPRHVDIPELWLDNTDTGVSVTGVIEAIKALQEPTCNGAPPPLLAIWGDRRERVELDDYHIDEMFHSPAGAPLRAKVTLNLKEIQQ